MTIAQTVTISGSTVSVLETMLKPKYTLDQRKIVSFTVRDDTGTLLIQIGQPVTITDSVSGLLFSGYVNDAMMTNLFPNATNTIAVQCVDNKSLADAIYAKKDYVEEYGGDIACDLVANYLSSKGVTAAFALRRDTTLSQFGQGTLSSVIGANNVGDGDLELASAGTAVSIVEDSDFTTGNLTNTDGSTVPGQLQLASVTAMKLTGTSVPGASNNYTYIKIWSGSMSVASGDTLRYFINIASTSPVISGGVDLLFSDNTNLRDSGLNDQSGMSAHPVTDLTNYAKDTRYFRQIDLTSLAGKTLTTVSVSLEGDSSGTYTAYIDTVQIFNNTPAVKQSIFTGTLATNTQISNIGYANVSLTTLTTYTTSGTRISPAYSMAAAGIVRSSIISWTQALSNGIAAPPGTQGPDKIPYITIESSLDGGATYQICTNNSPIPNLLAGMNLATRNIQFRQTLNVAGPDPTISPVLTEMSISISPSYNASKTDSISQYSSPTDWNSGTLSNTVAQGDGTLGLNGAFKNWKAGDLTSQTVFGGTPTQQAAVGTLAIRCDGGTDVRCRLDFAGAWGDFICEVDVEVVDSTGSYGIEYRTTNWGNSNGSYAYSAMISTTQVILTKGTNSTGAGSSTTIGSPVSLTTAVGWYRMKTVISGSNHKIYINDVLYINATDATYSAAGNIGLRHNNPSGSRHSGFFNNVGVLVALSGTWISPATSLTALSTLGSSVIQWNESGASNTSFLLEASTDGGSTYATCTNGGALPGLSPGASTSGKSLVLKATFTADNANVTPELIGLSAIIQGGYSASGNRISPVLSLAGVAGPAGSTLVSWNGLQPANTTIGVDISLDAITWTSAGSGALGSAAIAGVAVQPSPTDDAFSTNTSSSYTSTARTGGTNATWVWDTANNRVTVSSGTNALLLNSSISTSDIDLIADLDESDASGVVWRVQDASNYYELVPFDASSSAGSTNVLKLYKVVANVRSQIGSNITISFKRGTPYRTRVTMIGTAITVYFDGTSVLSTTDNSLAGPGQCGLSSQTGIARFYQLRIQPLTASVVALSIYSRVRLTSTDPTVTPQLEDLTLSVRSTSIQNGALIPVAPYSVLSGSTNTIAQDFDDISKQSNLVWDIDQNKAFSMQARNGVPAPWIASAIDSDTSNIQYAGVSVETIADLYRNTEFLSGGTDTIAFPETRMGDSISQSWTMGYAVDSINSITVNGIKKTVGIKGVDTGKDFYYTQGNNSIIQDPSQQIYDNTQTLIFNYNAIVSITVEMRNDAQILAKAAVDGTDGIIALVEDVSTLNLTKAAIIQLGQGRLDQYAIIGRTAKFTTMRSGLAVGQILPIFMPQFSVINGQFLITDVAPSWISIGSGGLQPFYSVTATEGPVVGNYTRFLANLAKG